MLTCKNDERENIWAPQAAWDLLEQVEAARDLLEQVEAARDLLEQVEAARDLQEQVQAAGDLDVTLSPDRKGLSAHNWF